MKHWFTADTHFGHTNIIQYCERPFRLSDPALCTRCGGNRPDWQDSHGNSCCHPDLSAHDEALIENWNKVVDPSDIVHHLGDFALTSLPAISAIMRRLNGTKFLVKGNHDRHTNSAYLSVGFKEVSRQCSLNIDGFRLKLIHDFKRVDDDLWGYDAVLCGHVHEAWRERTVEASRWGEKKQRRVINCGVDVWDYRPVSLAELRDGALARP